MERIDGGYILKARKIQDSKIQNCNPCTREVWDYLLRSANYKTNNVCERGQLIRTVPNIIKDLEWKVGYRTERYKTHSVEYALKALRALEMITTRRTTRGSIITIENYSYYQDPTNYEYWNDRRNERHTIAGIVPNDKQESKERKNKNNTSSPLVEEVISYLNNAANKKFKSSSKRTAGYITARAKEGFTLEDFKKAIDIKSSQWVGTQMDMYLRPATLFNSEKFEGYVNEASQQDKGAAAKQKVMDIMDSIEQEALGELSADS